MGKQKIMRNIRQAIALGRELNTEIMLLIERVTSDEVIERALEWLCERRQHYHYNTNSV